MENPASYKWKPIAPLGEVDRARNLSDLDALVNSWRKFRTQFDSRRVREFHNRVLREWSIETGIIEHLYTVDAGTTKVLIEEGFLADIVDRSGTSLSPESLIAILRDHQAAAELLTNGISKTRSLSRNLICELHQILTRHQDSCEAIDQHGRPLTIPLRKGAFKIMPNNPTRPDGTMHEYCPPIQVESEIENLVNWYNQYKAIHPMVLAAWLHHRFSQIHPFHDGNGRVARALVMLVLLQADYLPIIVGRDLRKKYLDALEAADIREDLGPLIALFQQLEESVILRALSAEKTILLEKQAPGEVAADPVAAAAAEIAESLFAQSAEPLKSPEETVDPAMLIAQSLNRRAQEYLTQRFSALCEQLNSTRERFDFTEAPGRDSLPDAYLPIILDLARSLGVFPNVIRENQSLWTTHCLAYPIPGGPLEHFDFITSLQTVGPAGFGVFVGLSFFIMGIGEDYVIMPKGANRISEWTGCTPLLFTCSVSELVDSKDLDNREIDVRFSKLEKRHREWLDLCLADGLRKWKEKYIEGRFGPI